MSGSDALRSLYLWAREYGVHALDVIHGKAHGADARARLAGLLEAAEAEMAAGENRCPNRLHEWVEGSWLTPPQMVCAMCGAQRGEGMAAPVEAETRRDAR